MPDICIHCGDHTDIDDDDPAPDLCFMCAKAARAGHTTTGEVNGARWFNVRAYCYTCGLVSRIPFVGAIIVRHHLRRIAKKILHE